MSVTRLSQGTPVLVSGAVTIDSEILKQKTSENHCSNQFASISVVLMERGPAMERGPLVLDSVACKVMLTQSESTASSTIPPETIGMIPSRPVAVNIPPVPESPINITLRSQTVRTGMEIDGLTYRRRWAI